MKTLVPFMTGISQANMKCVDLPIGLEGVTITCSSLGGSQLFFLHNYLCSLRYGIHFFSFIIKKKKKVVHTPII